MSSLHRPSGSFMACVDYPDPDEGDGLYRAIIASELGIQKPSTFHSLEEAKKVTECLLALNGEL